MKANEFSLNPEENKENDHGIGWFEYLNNYVTLSSSVARNYHRVVAINPDNPEKALQDVEWVNKMVEALKSNKVVRCSVSVVLRDITVSCVLLDSKVSFFSFLLVEESLKSFMEITSLGEKTGLNDIINSWFDRKFESKQYLLYKYGEIDKGVLNSLRNSITV